jgi:sulfur-oxidizing protein SoxA
LFLCFGLLCAVPLFAAKAQSPAGGMPPAHAENPLKELIPGRRFVPGDIAAQQADDFDNPAFPLILEAEKLFDVAEGLGGKSCASCHGNGRGLIPVTRAAASYPQFHDETKRVINLEQRINMCRERGMRAAPWSAESPELIGMTGYIKHLSRGTPFSGTVNGASAITFEAGKTLFETRIGRLQLSCAQCHNERYGQKFSGDTISQGHPLDYPAYNNRAARVISLHERFRLCNALARAEPQSLGSEDYVALELYLSWRSKNLPIEAPGVRP